MKGIDLVKRVKNEGKVLTVYGLCKTRWEYGVENCNPLSEEYQEGFYCDIDEARKAMQELADETKPEFGVTTEIILCVAEIGPDDIDGIDTDEDFFDDDDLLEVFKENRDFEDSIYKDYEYKSLDGALLVFWRWDKYVGYARNIAEIREGWHEDESICIKRDSLTATQCDVLATKEELEGLSDSDRKTLIRQHLDESRWKWTFRAEAFIEDYISDNF